MSDMSPHPLSPEDWKQIASVPAVREAWGLKNSDPSDLATQVYAAKFKFFSGSPGYVGDVFILQGDTLSGDPPVVLRRAEDASLLVS